MQRSTMVRRASAVALAAGLLGSTQLAGAADTAVVESTATSTDAEQVLDTDVVQSTFQAALGDRYGGAFVVDPQDGGGDDILIGVKNATPADRQRAAELFDPKLVKVSNVKYAIADLEAYQALVTDYLLSPASGQPAFSVGKTLRDPSSAIPIVLSVSIDQLTQARREAIDALVPSSATALSGEYSATPAHASRYVFPPYEGGLAAQVVNPYNWNQVTLCTSGYTMVSAYGYFGTTAGHCAYTHATSGPDPVYMGPVFPGSGTVYVDSIRSNPFYGSSSPSADVLAYSLSAGGYSGSGTILVAANTHRTVVSRYTSSPMLGTSLCFVGITSGNGNCGSVLFVDQQLSLGGGRWLRDVDCFATTDDADPGDSGGPVYFLNGNGTVRAAGLVFGEALLDGGLVTCQTHIQNVVSALGAEVVLG